MSKKKVEEDDDGELTRAFAVLISNTRSNKRPLPLTEIAKWLNIAVSKLGSYSAVADRLGLSAKMLRQFSYVDRLAPVARKLAATRELDSVDAVAHLAMLPPTKQRPIAEALMSGEIATSDVRAVAQLYRSHYSDSITAILKRVKSMKRKREYIAEFIVRGSRDEKQIVKRFQKYIPSNEIIRVEVDGILGRLVLTETGKKELFKTATNLGVSINQVIPKILEG